MLTVPSSNSRLIVRLLKQGAWLLVFSGLLRVFYLARNPMYFNGEKAADIAWAFVVGLRFDLALLALLLFPLFLFFSLPWSARIAEGRGAKTISQLWLAAVVLLLAIPNVADAELLHFTGRRLTLSLLHNSQDMGSIAIPLAFEYWYLTFPTLAVSLLTSLGINKVREGKGHRSMGLGASLLAFLTLTLAFGLAIRGGLQGKPLRPQHAVVFNRTAKGALLSINSTHSLLTSLNARTLEPVHLLPASQKELVAALKKSQIFGNDVPEFDNVVVLILESIGKEYLKSPLKPVSDIPFIESLGERGLLFENNYANGSISMMAINSVLASLPPFNLGALAYSGYADTKVNGLPAILKKYGYQSAFFHGGPKGVFYFDSMALHAGFDRYIGQDEFKGKPQLKNYWGIDDDSYLQFMGEQLNQMREPFIAGCFTLSNHFPYAAPESFLKTEGPGSKADKYRGARFTDYAVRRFFASIEHYPWYHRTLFILTGDHPAHEHDALWEKTLPVYQMVPLVFFHPGKKLGEGRSLRITQQADVVPSVLDFLGLGEREKNAITPFGHSVFQPSTPGQALVGFESGDFFLASGDSVSHFNMKDGAKRQLRLSSALVRVDPKAATVPAESRDFFIKGSLQYFVNGVIGNELYPLDFNQQTTLVIKQSRDSQLLH